MFFFPSSFLSLFSSFFDPLPLFFSSLLPPYFQNVPNFVVRVDEMPTSPTPGYATGLTDYGQGQVSAKNHERWGITTKMLCVIATKLQFMTNLLRCPLLEIEGQSIADV